MSSSRPSFRWITSVSPMRKFYPKMPLLGLIGPMVKGVRPMWSRKYRGRLSGPKFSLFWAASTSANFRSASSQRGSPSSCSRPGAGISSSWSPKKVRSRSWVHRVLTCGPARAVSDRAGNWGLTRASRRTDGQPAVLCGPSLSESTSSVVGLFEFASRVSRVGALSSPPEVPIHTSKPQLAEGPLHCQKHNVFPDAGILASASRTKADSDVVRRTGIRSSMDSEQTA